MNRLGDNPDTPDGSGDLRDDPISQGLRQLLASVTEEPVPDEFMDLLDSLDERRASASGAMDDGQSRDTTPQENV